MPKIFSHVHGDPDSIMSQCAVVRLVPGMENAERIHVSGRWKGAGMGPDDVAVDIPAGEERGIKGTVEGGVVHSALASVVAKYAGSGDAKALEKLVEFVDIQDSCGSVIVKKIPYASMLAKRVLGGSNIGRVIFALRAVHTAIDASGKEVVDEETVFHRVLEIFDGLLEMGRAGIPFEDGVDPDYIDYYLLRRYRNMHGARAIEPILLFYNVKLSLREPNHLVVDDLLGVNSDPEIRKLFAKNSIDAVFRALKYFHRNNEETFFARAREILNGFLMMDEADARAEAAANKAELFTGGKVALTMGGPPGTNNALRKRGVVAVVYRDGINLGVVVKGRPFYLKDGTRLRADHPAIREVVEKSGDDLKLWFAHSAGFLFCNGCRKAPTDTSSMVNPHDLVRVLSNLLS